MDVASLLRLNIRRRGPGQVYADCPICGDHRGKMNLNLTKNIWRCNYCGEGGGMLALYAKVHGVSSKVHLLAAKHGLACRQLVWNPAYKGIDDWQLPCAGKKRGTRFGFDRTAPPLCRM